MEKTRIRVFYIEDNPVDAQFVASQLEEAPEFELTCVDSLEEGIGRLQKEAYDILLLDLNLPDSPGGLETYQRVRAGGFAGPVVVHTAIDDETLGRNAVRRGAQDYLVKGHTDGLMLVKAIRFALERHHDERFFHTMVFSCSTPVLVVNWKGIVRFLNPAAEQLFGKKAEDWVDHTYGYPVDPDQPMSIHIEGQGEFEASVTETEMRGEVLNVIHLKKAPINA